MHIFHNIENKLYTATRKLLSKFRSNQFLSQEKMSKSRHENLLFANCFGKKSFKSFFLVTFFDKKYSTESDKVQCGISHIFALCFYGLFRLHSILKLHESHFSLCTFLLLLFNTSSLSDFYFRMFLFREHVPCDALIPNQITGWKLKLDNIDNHRILLILMWSGVCRSQTVLLSYGTKILITIFVLMVL